MKSVKRYLQPQVEADLARKMVFLAGPRQVGKTTLALGIKGARAGYLNWDIPADRSRILAGDLPWSTVSDAGPRFENLVACHLLKWVHHQQDTEGRALELRYFRDSDGREVDFVVTEKLKPILFVECKYADADPDRGIRYLHGKFPEAEAWQISAIGKKDFVTAEGIRMAPALALLARLV